MILIKPIKSPNQLIEMRNYDLITELIHRIKAQDSVKSEEQLKSENWTKSCYDLLSRIISKKLMNLLSDTELMEMGSSISYKTLKTLFDGKYVLKYPLDPRALNTLNKLAKFIDIDSWNDFAAKIRSANEEEAAKAKPEDRINFVLHNALDESFKAIHKLSLNGSVQLRSFFQDESPAFNRIAELVHYNKRKGLSISNKYNPSNYELLEFEIDTIGQDKAMVSTKEFWLLCWWDESNERYRKRLKKICQNQYVLIRTRDNQWKITKTITEDDLFIIEEEAATVA